MIKVKVHTLDIAPLHIVNHHCRSTQVWHVFPRDITVLPAHAHVHPQSEWAIPAFAFPALASTHLLTPEGWMAEYTWCDIALTDIWTCNLPIANLAALYHIATSALILVQFHSFTCTPTRSSAIGMSHTCLCLPSLSWSPPPVFSKRANIVSCCEQSINWSEIVMQLRVDTADCSLIVFFLI